MNRTLSLKSTPTRIGPIAAMTLIELALKREAWLSIEDLNELEHIVIDAIRELEEHLRPDDSIYEPLELEDGLGYGAVSEE